MAFKAHSWCFTTNNWTETDYADATDLYETHNAKYLVIGFETGKEGTPHLQCFVHFKDSVTFNTMKKYLPRSHIEKMQTTHSEALNYCKKDGNYIEFGSVPAQGKITYETMREVMANPHANFYLFHQYRRAWNDLNGMRPRVDTRFVTYISDKKVNLLPLHDTFDARNYGLSFIPYYDQEPVVLVNFDQLGTSWVDMWSRDTPIRYVFGYQSKYFDPARVIIVVPSDEELDINQITILGELEEYKI